MNVTDENRYISVEQYSEDTDIPVEIVIRMIKNGELAGRIKNNSWYVDAELSTQITISPDIPEDPIDQKLDGTIGQVFHFVRGHLKALFNIAFIPVGSLFLLSAFMAVVAPELFSDNGQALDIIIDSPVEALLRLAEIVLLTLFSTAWHRYVIGVLTETSVVKGLAWGAEEFRFLSYVFAIGLIVVAIIASISFVLDTISSLNQPVSGNPTTKMPEPAGFYGIWLLVGLILVFYYIWRLSLVFPSAAIGGRLTMRESFRMTRGLGWRIFRLNVIVLAAGLLISFLIGVITGFFLLTGSVFDHILVAISGVLAAFIGVALQLTAWSIVFHRLRHLVPDEGRQHGS